MSGLSAFTTWNCTGGQSALQTKLFLLESVTIVVRFLLSMKRLTIYCAIALSTLLLLNSCASDSGSTASGDSVPGEKVSDEGRVSPGVGTAGPNASVRW